MEPLGSRRRRNVGIGDGRTRDLLEPSDDTPVSEPGVRSWHDLLAGIRGLRPLFATAWQCGRAFVLISILIRCARAVIPALVLWVWMLLLDAAVAFGRGSPGAAADVWNFLVMECALIAVGEVLARTSNYCATTLTDRVASALSMRMIENVQRVELMSFEDPAFRDRLDRARRRTGTRLSVLASVMGVGQDSLSLLVFCVLFVTVSPWLLLWLGCVAIPGCLADIYGARRMHDLTRARSSDQRYLDYIRFLGASVQGAKEVKLFGLGRHLLSRYADGAQAMEAETSRVAARQVLWAGASSLISVGGFFIACAFVVRRFLDGTSSLGAVMITIRGFSSVRSNVERISAGVADMLNEALWVKDLFSCLDAGTCLPAAERRIRLRPRIRDGFKFEDVGFVYPGSRDWVLKGVNLHLRVGETVALIGGNGVGKTTLVKLLTRLYAPTAGRILLDGIDLAEYDVDELRARIGVVFQDFVRYDMAVRDNIGFGNIAAIGDNARLTAAARSGGADALIQRLPAQYEQMLGRRFAGGVELSGGEWQRLALARAYLRNGQILILDEPTAGLDPQSEHEILKRIRSNAECQMILLISHRLSAARCADRVVVLRNGTVHEDGSHRELLAASGHYARLFALQAAAYR